MKKKLVLSILFSYILMVGMGFVLIVGVHLIPFKIVENNVNHSLEIVQKEGIHYDYLSSRFHLNVNKGNVFSQDGISDMVMLNEVFNVGKENPLYEALINTQVGGSPYGRYWHGYMVTLVPSLILMNLSEIRNLNYIFFFLLITVIAYLTWRKIGLATSGIFLLTLALSFFIVVPYSLQFLSVFYIGFVASILMLLSKKIRLLKNTVICFFFVGGLTSYMDLLTSPIISLGFPLIYWGMLEDGKQTTCMNVLLLCVFFFLGYGLMWSSKWILAYMITDIDIVTDAVNQSRIRTGGSELSTLFQHKIIFGSIIIQLIFVLYSVLFRKKWNSILKNLWLILIAIVPLIWLCMLKQHSDQHYWFVWRNLIIGDFALLLLIHRVTQHRKIKNTINIIKV